MELACCHRYGIYDFGFELRFLEDSAPLVFPTHAGYSVMVLNFLKSKTYIIYHQL